MILKYQVDAPAVGVEGGFVRPSPLKAAFERFSDRIKDFQPFFERLQGRLEAAAKRQFGAEGQGPVAGKWKALTPRYAEQKLRRFGPQPILVASGELRRQLSESGGGLRIVTDKDFAYGTLDVEYASHHQLGTKKMPARPPIDLDDGARAAISKDAAEHARAAWLNSGLAQHSTWSAVTEVEGLDRDLDEALREE